MTSELITTAAELHRCAEVASVATIVSSSRDDEGTLVLELDTAAADAANIYHVLYVAANGHVAQANVNQPAYLPTFAALLKAAK